MSNIIYKPFAVIILLSLTAGCFESGSDKTADNLLKTDTVYVTETVTDTIEVIKKVNTGDYRDIYVVAQQMAQSQLTGELKLFSDYKNSSVENAGNDIFKIQMIVLWHNGETQVESDVAINLKYFGGKYSDSDNWVTTYFGQVPRCFFRAPCGQ